MFDEWSLTGLTCDLSILHVLQKTLRAGQWKVTVAVHDSAQIIGIWPGFHEGTDRGTPLHGGGEQHAFYSLVDRGYAVSYTPDAVVRHPFPSTMEAVRSRYLRDLTASTAYFTMMLVEEPRNRVALLRYLWESVKGTPRSWRGDVTQRPRVVPFYRSAGALAAGPFKYLQGLVQTTP